MSLFVLQGCEQRPEARPSRVLKLMTGDTGGGFEVLGEALARSYRATRPDIKVEVSRSTSIVANVRAVQSGEADVAFANADIAYLAFVGQLAEQPQPFDHLRGIAVLYVSPLHIIVRGESSIQDILELRGRRVGFPGPGTSGELSTRIILKALGIEVNTINLESLPVDEIATRLTDGTVDGLFIMGNHQAEAVRNRIGQDARLLSLSGPVVERLRHEYQFFRHAVIPRDIYPKGPIRTVGIESLLICRSDLDQGLVHEITRSLFEALPLVASQLKSVRSMDLNHTPATPIPLHEGATRYYREQEVSR